MKRPTPARPRFWRFQQRFKKLVCTIETSTAKFIEMESVVHEKQWRKKVENRETSNNNRQNNSIIKKTQRIHDHHKNDEQKSTTQPQLKSAITEKSVSHHKSGKYKPPTLYQQRFVKLASAKNSSTFSVMCYNILANCNISKQYFPYCRRHELDWNQRVPKLIKRIHRFAADLLCLQEVENYPHFEIELAKQNYAGVYKQRTGANKDGCAIFYNKKKFEMIDHTLVEYNQSHNIEWMDRDNVGIVCMLKYLGKTNNNNENNSNNQDNQNTSQQLVCIANTHLLFNPKRGDIKLAQLQMLFMSIKAMVARYSESNPSVVVCGGIAVIILFNAADFNLTPNSFLFESIARGSANLDSMDSRTASGQLSKYQKQVANDSDSDPMDSENTSKSSLKLHEYQLKSAYHQYYEEDPIVTSYHSTFKGTVDYVWYSSDNLALHQLLSVPTVNEVDSGLLGRGLPNIVQPSDHLPLYAQFGFPEQ